MVVATRSPNGYAAVVLCQAVDAAGNNEVLDGSIIEAIERSTWLVEVVVSTAESDGQRMSVAVEDAFERMTIVAHHLADGNVIRHQLEIDATKVIGCLSTIEVVGYKIPT